MTVIDLFKNDETTYIIFQYNKLGEEDNICVYDTSAEKAISIAKSELIEVTASMKMYFKLITFGS